MKYCQLRKIIFEKGVNLRNLARLTGIKRIALYAKMLGIVEFRAWEILRISAVLSLERWQVEKIFFGEKVS